MSDNNPAHEQATSQTHVDDALARVADQAEIWAATTAHERAALLRELIAATLNHAGQWVAASVDQPEIATTADEAWINEIAPLVRTMAVLATSYDSIAAHGAPTPPNVAVGTDGQVHVDLLPISPRDKALFPGINATARLAPDVGIETLYADLDQRLSTPAHGAALVLGAGNIASIAPLDIIHQLFVNNHPVVCKPHPRLAYLGEVFETIFSPLIERDLVRIVAADTPTTQRALQHPRLSTVHLTGSERTYAEVRAALDNRDGAPVALTAERGNVTPIIVVPGPWTRRDLARQGRRIAAMITNNGAYNCVAPRLVIQHRAWASRRTLTRSIVRGLADVPTRPAYDDSTWETWRATVETRPQVDRIEPAVAGHMPYAFVHGLDPNDADEPLFTEEIFSGIVGGVDLDAPRSIPAFVDRAVAWCNSHVFGSLAAIVLVHPRTLADAGVAVAVERATRTLNYGIVAVNTYPGVAFGLGSAPWGAHAHDTADASWVHNGLLLDSIDNVVVRGRFNDPMVAAWSPRGRGRARAGPALARLLAGDLG